MTTTDPHPDTPLWSPHFIALLLANWLLCSGFYMLPSTLPAYVKQIGGSHFETSLVIGSFSIMSLCSRIFSSAAVDHFGEKRLIYLGAATIAATTLAFIWMPIDGILLLRSVQGIGWGLSTAAIATAVYKIVPEARRGEGSGYYALTVIAALSLTPLLAILLMTSFGHAVLLTVSGLLTCATFTLLGRGLQTMTPPVQHPDAVRKISLRNVFEREALLPALLCFLNSVPLCGVMVYLVLFGKEQSIDSIWLFFIGYTAMILLTRPYIGRLFDRKGHRPIILPGCMAMVLGLIALSQTHSTPMLIVASLLYGLGYGAVHPSLQTWAVNRCPTDRKAAANGLYLSAIDLGYIVGAMTLGLLAASTGYAAMYTWSIVALIVFALIYSYVEYIVPKQTAAPPIK